METYINSGRDKYIVDKDKIYTKRKQRRIALNEPSEEPNTKQAKPTPFQPVYPSCGWSNDLKRMPFLPGRKLIFSFQIPAKTQHILRAYKVILGKRLLFYKTNI